jgi:peptidoglycan/xylan/chitin deacetylase (PgdA/CDA1 family)
VPTSSLSLLALVKRVAGAAGTRGRSRFLGVAGVGIARILERVARLSSRQLGVALVYHGVGEPPGDPRRELVPALATSLFAKQVNHLVSHYRLVTSSELTTAVRERQRGQPFPVAITFDDDLASHVEVAAPVLAEVGATATFFVSGASLHDPHRFWWQRLQDALARNLDLSGLGLERPSEPRSVHRLGLRIQNLPPRARDELDVKLAELVGPDPPDSGLRAELLRSLAASGVEIGFHTRRHDQLPTLGDEELEDAMRVGRREVEDLVGQPLRTISYPHGEADERVAAAARAAGFVAGFTGARGVVTAANHPLLLSRISPSYTSLGELAFRISWALFRGAFSGRGKANLARLARRSNSD